jgi:hypothetical protein
MSILGPETTSIIYDEQINVLTCSHFVKKVVVLKMKHDSTVYGEIGRHV